MKSPISVFLAEPVLKQRQNQETHSNFLQTNSFMESGSDTPGFNGKAPFNKSRDIFVNSHTRMQPLTTKNVQLAPI